MEQLQHKFIIYVQTGGSKNEMWEGRERARGREGGREGGREEDSPFVYWGLKRMSHFCGQ